MRCLCCPMSFFLICQHKNFGVHNSGMRWWICLQSNLTLLFIHSEVRIFLYHWITFLRNRMLLWRLPISILGHIRFKLPTHWQIFSGQFHFYDWSFIKCVMKTFHNAICNTWNFIGLSNSIIHCIIVLHYKSVC